MSCFEIRNLQPKGFRIERPQLIVKCRIGKGSRHFTDLPIMNQTSRPNAWYVLFHLSLKTGYREEYYYSNFTEEENAAWGHQIFVQSFEAITGTEIHIVELDSCSSLMESAHGRHQQHSCSACFSVGLFTITAICRAKNYKELGPEAQLLGLL